MDRNGAARAGFAPLVAFLASLAAFAAVFYAFHGAFGGSLGSAGLVPVAIAAWYFGPLRGALATAAVVATIGGVHVTLGHSFFEPLAEGSIGTVMLVAAGLGIGHGGRLVRENRARSAALGRANAELEAEAARRATAETSLRESEERLRLAFDEAFDGIVLADSEVRCIRANRVACEMIGLSEAEVVGRDILGLVHPDDRGRAEAAVRSMASGESSAQTVEARLVHRRGHAIWVRAAATVVRDASGRPIQYVAHVVDISARMAAEKRASDRERQQAAVAALGGQALAGADPATLLEEVAPRLAAALEAPVVGVLQMSPDGAWLEARGGVGWRAASAYRMPAAAVPAAFWSGAPIVLRDARTGGPEYEELRAEGVVSGVFVPVAVEGARYAMLSVLSREWRDFTPADCAFLSAVANVLAAAIHRAAQERAALRQSEKLATMGSLAAGVAHEINNPLTFLRMRAELDREAVLERVAAGRLEPEDRALLESLAGNGEKVIATIDRLAEMTRSLKRVARASRGTRSVEDVGAVVDGVLLVAASRLRHDVTVRRDYAPGLACPLDAAGMSQVLLNLIVNAADALADRADATITIRTRDGAGVVAIEVEDNGPGIPPEHQARIFVPFFTTKAEGTGLGLSISRRIVEEHGGTLTFRSAVGRGTTFRVEVPLVPADASAANGAAVATVPR